MKRISCTFRFPVRVQVYCAKRL